MFSDSATKPLIAIVVHARLDNSSRFDGDTYNPIELIAKHLTDMRQSRDAELEVGE